MKEMFKNLLAAVCVTAFLFSGISTYAYEVIPEPEEEPAAVLAAIGIIDKQGSTDAAVTRAEFADLMARMCGVNSLAAGRESSPFSDVKKTDEYYNQICWMYDMGYAKGGEYNAYEPNRSVTYGEAVKVAVDILGYHMQAEKAGGYPFGYISEACRIGAADGVSASADDPLTYKNMYRLMLSSLEAEPFMDFMIESVDSDNLTLLYRNFSVKKIKGIVTSDGITSLGGTRVCNAGDIAIDGIFYKQASASYSEYIGCNTEAYISEDEIGGRTVFYVSPYRTERVRIEAFELESAQNREISCSKNGTGAVRKFRLDSAFDYIYNYKSESISGWDDIIPQSGYIELTDNDNDGEYEVVRVFERANMLITYINAGSGILYNSNRGKILDLSENDIEYNIYSGDEIIEIKDLEAEDVLTYYMSRDGKYMTAFVSKEFTQGRIQSVSEENGETVIRIGDKSYKVAYDCNRVPEAGYRGEFYINAYGEIVDIEQMFGECEAYGYLFYVGVDNDNDDELIANMFTTNGFLETLAFAEKVTVNGEPLKTKETIYSALCTDASGNASDIPEEQPLRYKTNGAGKIILIDNIAQNWGGDDDCFALGKAKSSLVHKRSGVFSGDFAVNTDTAAIYIPENTNDKNEFMMFNPANFKEDKTYTVAAYNLDETRIAEFVLVYENTNAKAMGIMYVDKIISAVNDDNENIIKAEGWIDGAYRSVSSLNTDRFAMLTRGDVIRYSLDRSGYAKDYELWFDASERKAGSAGGTITANEFVQYGPVKSANEDVVLLKVSDETSYVYSLLNMTLYKYDTKEKTITKSNWQEIKSAEKFGNDASYLFIYTNGGFSRSGMIIE